MAAPLTGSLAEIVRTGVHPFVLRALGSSAAALAHPASVYHPSMAAHLPRPSDSAGILNFFGLDSAAAQRTLQAAGSEVQNLPAQVQDPARGFWRFPLSDALLQAYIDSAPPAPRPVPPTWEGWFACAQQQGLRPEFACTVGLHPTDPRYRPDHADFYQSRDAQEVSRDKVVANKYILDVLWGDQIKEQQGGDNGLASA